MAQVNMIFTRLLELGGSGALCVGGVETYILRLSQLIAALGHEPVLFQQADCSFKTRVGPLLVIGVPPRSASPERLYEAACKHDPAPDPVILFCAEQIACRSRSKRSILIQNGVYWDLPNRYWTRLKLQRGPVFGVLSRFYTTVCKIRDMRYARYRVCVDLNFVNWFRSVCDGPDETHMFYIPNCCGLLSAQEVQQKLQRHSGIVQVVFARRFFEYRGTRIFAEACSRLATEFPDLRVLICGEGPEEPFLRQTLGDKSNIHINKVPWSEMPALLKRTDIAVVPSLGSEGTSFALCEAMGAACAVICSNVGGMTNMVIHGHNGLLMWPNASDCYSKMRDLLTDQGKRLRLAEMAWRTAQDSFSEEKWGQSWREVLQRCISGEKR